MNTKETAMSAATIFRLALIMAIAFLAIANASIAAEVVPADAFVHIKALMKKQASLDCAAPRLPLEKFICSDSILISKDNELDDAYQLALGAAATPVERQQLQAEEQAWLKSRQTHCNIGLKPHDPERLDADPPEKCLADFYDDRIERLNLEKTRLESP